MIIQIMKRTILISLAFYLASIFSLQAQIEFGVYEFSYSSCVSPNDSVTAQPIYGQFSKIKRMNLICNNALQGTWNTQGYSTGLVCDTSQYIYFSLQLTGANTFSSSDMSFSFTSEKQNQGPTSASMMYRYGSSSFQTCYSWTPATTMSINNATIPAPPDLNQTYLEIRFYGWGAVSSGAYMNLDILSLKGDSPLPVQLLVFYSSVEKNAVTLYWETGFESNNKGFNIERKNISIENSNWINSGFIQGNGSTNTKCSYQFIDRNIRKGIYRYRLKQIDFNGNFEYHYLKSDVIIEAPEKFKISQNQPNPFNSKTRINFELPDDSKVNVQIFDMLGREIANLENEFMHAGYHSSEFDGSNLSSGIYFYRIIIDNKEKIQSKTMKMLMIK